MAGLVSFLGNLRQSLTRSDFLIASLLAGEGLLWLSQRYQWFAFNTHKGWTVLIAVASVIGTLLVMLLALGVGLLFRWRFQFSIRFMLGLTLAAALASGWLATELAASRRQAEAAAQLTRSAFLVWDYEIGYLPTSSGAAPLPGPEWVRKLLGDDHFFANVVYVHTWMTTAFSTVTDKDLTPLEALPALDKLELLAVDITDEGLRHLGALHGLRELRVSSEKITDRALTYLRDLRSLEVLELMSEKVTDYGLLHLQKLQELRSLTLHGSITDQGMKHLKALKKLTRLMVWHPREDLALLRISKEIFRPTGMEFKDCPLTEVVRYLEDYHNIKICFDDRVPKDLREESITMVCKGVSLNEGLARLLCPLELDWYADRRGIVIAPREVVAERHAGLIELQKAVPTLKEVFVDW